MKTYTDKDMRKAFEAGEKHYKYNYTENGGMFSDILHPKFKEWLKKYNEQKKVNN